MLFSSITFIYYFLPILFLFYFLIPDKYKNFILLIFSLLFYFLGEPKYIIVLLFSCFINYYLSKLISKDKNKKLFLVLGLIYNIGQLFIFKYIDFFIDNFNNLFNLSIPFTYIIMPIGISFFTFQNISYLIDVYDKKHNPCNSLINYMTYITMFPQLVAGPIVRYETVYGELEKRKIDYIKFSKGIKRFIIGLSKKVLIANVLGEIISSLIEISLLSSWLKPVLFTLQIYYDFSGYSDMAIGLGLMLGFTFLENFNYPFIATSITDFWRRWHMSLSSFFKDYVYIKLGGNRVNKFKWIINILIVWLLTGFWHGASWNFIIWGLYFGIILIIEKLFLKKYFDKTKLIKYLYTLVIIVISFLIFEETSLQNLVISLKNMFFVNDIPLVTKEVLYHLRNNIILIIVSMVGATPLLKNVIKNLRKTKLNIVIDIFEIVFYIILLTLTTAFLIDESFNPFLYFRF